MILTITISKTVTDRAEAEGLAQIVREKLSAHPDVKIKSEVIDTLPES